MVKGVNLSSSQEDCVKATPSAHSYSLSVVKDYQLLFVYLCKKGHSEEPVLVGMAHQSHLLFADESILFIEASGKGATVIKDILKEYGDCSGQSVNFNKSTIFFNRNTKEEDQLNISRTMDIKISTNTKKYLGLPNIVGRSRKASFQYIKDKIITHIDSWSNRVLSQGGKETFIKSVLQAIPTYTLSCFLMPKSFYTDIENILARYWWQKGKGQKGTHWCTWKNLCQMKELGGLGYEEF